MASGSGKSEIRKQKLEKQDGLRSDFYFLISDLPEPLALTCVS
jgi:hypothetical protein